MLLGTVATHTAAAVFSALLLEALRDTGTISGQSERAAGGIVAVDNDIIGLSCDNLISEI